MKGGVSLSFKSRAIGKRFAKAFVLEKAVLMCFEPLKR